MKGERVRTLAHLLQLAKNRRSVVFGAMQRPIPAAYVGNWPAFHVHNLMTRYLMWVWDTPKKKGK